MEVKHERTLLRLTESAEYEHDAGLSAWRGGWCVEHAEEKPPSSEGDVRPRRADKLQKADSRTASACSFLLPPLAVRSRASHYA